MGRDVRSFHAVSYHHGPHLPTFAPIRLSSNAFPRVSLLKHIDTVFAGSELDSSRHPFFWDPITPPKDSPFHPVFYRRNF
jgi:hypothetical protein